MKLKQSFDSILKSAHESDEGPFFRVKPIRWSTANIGIRASIQIADVYNHNYQQVVQQPDSFETKQANRLTSFSGDSPITSYIMGRFKMPALVINGQVITDVTGIRHLSEHESVHTRPIARNGRYQVTNQHKSHLMNFVFEQNKLSLFLNLPESQVSSRLKSGVQTLASKYGLSLKQLQFKTSYEERDHAG
ncbi:hypothetical protein [Woodsholea maritima]|uniref:hypothetical protein n=1 Tax=Woodsholea maritima TaxID=240237 RepID=UPI00146159E9|nr:hypothetical protein [Woodsholea maritima]